LQVTHELEHVSAGACQGRQFSALQITHSTEQGDQHRHHEDAEVSAANQQVAPSSAVLLDHAQQDRIRRNKSPEIICDTKHCAAPSLRSTAIQIPATPVM